MSHEQPISTDPTPQFPGNWRIAADYDPNQHLISLKGRDYLNVQNRLLWFIRDQRDFIAEQFGNNQEDKNRSQRADDRAG